MLEVDLESTVAHEQGCISFNMKRNKVRGGGKSIVISESFTISGLKQFVEIIVSKNTIRSSITTVILRRTYNLKLKIKPFSFVLKLDLLASMDHHHS
jgi:hypothetical protein